MYGHNSKMSGKTENGEYLWYFLRKCIGLLKELLNQLTHVFTV